MPARRARPVTAVARGARWMVRHGAHPGRRRAARVRALCAVPLPGGRVLVASAGSDAVVRLWDPVSGESVGVPLAGHDGRIWAVCAVADSAGRTLLASAGDDRTVRLWEPGTCRPVVGPLIGHTRAVWAVKAVPGADGRTLLGVGER